MTKETHGKIAQVSNAKERKKQKKSNPKEATPGERSDDEAQQLLIREKADRIVIDAVEIWQSGAGKELLNDLIVAYQHRAGSFSDELGEAANQGLEAYLEAVRQMRIKGMSDYEKTLSCAYSNPFGVEWSDEKGKHLRIVDVPTCVYDADAEDGDNGVDENESALTVFLATDVDADPSDISFWPLY